MGSFKGWITDEENQVVHETRAQSKQDVMDKLEAYLKDHPVKGGARHFRYQGDEVPSENE